MNVEDSHYIEVEVEEEIPSFEEKIETPSKTEKIVEIDLKADSNVENIENGSELENSVEIASKTVENGENVENIENIENIENGSELELSVEIASKTTEGTENASDKNGSVGNIIESGKSVETVSEGDKSVEIVSEGDKSVETASKSEESVEANLKMKYNVIWPSDRVIDYIPMNEYNVDEETNMNEIELIEKAIEIDRKKPNKHVTTFFFYSPPGLGKTVLGAYLAKKMNCPYQIINCVANMIDLDLLGSFVLVGNQTKWQDGPIPAIIRASNENGTGILILNELNALTVNAQMALNPLLDHQECVVLTQNNNEFLQIDSNSHLIILATMNPDVMGINDIQDSVRDRASAIFNWNYPAKDKEASLISKLTGLKLNWSNKFCDVIAECRKAKIVDRTVSKAPSTRATVDWVNYSLVWGANLAFELTISNRYGAGANAEDIDVLNRIARGKGINQWNINKNCFIGAKPKKVVDLIPADLSTTIETPEIQNPKTENSEIENSKIENMISEDPKELKQVIEIFENETGKNAIWHGSQTKQFIAWYNTKYSARSSA